MNDKIIAFLKKLLHDLDRFKYGMVEKKIKEEIEELTKEDD